MGNKVTVDVIVTFLDADERPHGVKVEIPVEDSYVTLRNVMMEVNEMPVFSVPLFQHGTRLHTICTEHGDVESVWH